MKETLRDELPPFLNGYEVIHMITFFVIVKSTRYKNTNKQLSILFRPFGFIAPKTLNYLVFQSFQSFDFERT